MQNTGLRLRVSKGYSFIVTAFDITLKLTQQVKIADKLGRFSERRKGQKTLIVPRCFDTFRPVNAVNSDLNHSLPIFQQ